MMTNDNTSSNFLEMACFVNGLVSTIPTPECYPVLGAHGHQPFIEISHGQLEDRAIFCTIYAEVDGCFRLGSIPAFPNKRETTIELPQFAYIIGLTRLLESKLRCSCKVLHPLNDHGDFFVDWQEAVISIIDGTT
ncbi:MULTISPECIES: hypothetical protein [Acidithiobacillus]|jgi:hypothetical protein|uniref:Uncharacterized protein n=1 Tax=Acidithiobacillus ferrooxidans TaxID=920 RepID=A0A2W1K0S6_ACIFR|nr:MULTISPECIES: hypothetical protein [Acidithiobacillus]MBU2774743.1 hypothetical protein [Acidithiobacillus ferrooxidans]MBU2794723.1 hypothetical protein [Acidithiobacillus thiooxidans]MBU2819382.1 hypothetical protein [Acidithiobacillus ferrooxidans]MBU2835010.1 hypothetical protein [Acidithiobacillus thiooxidans]MCR0969985.1 hypothetical protein [Acidithiobacillus ferrooxidans]